MENLFTHLEQVVLRMDSRFCTEDGHLLKNNVVEAALALDPKLLHYLLADEKLRKQFFREVDGLFVFDKVQFQRFVMNKQFLPDSYTSFKNKVGLTNENGEFLSESREIVLSWPYKDCMLEGGQTKEDAKRNEIFWNETLAPDEINRLTEPKALCNFRRYDSKGEHETTELLPDDNLIIKGNNLLALYSLRQRFRGKVKLIYIDPPYNTGNDSFGYNDSFNHSTWLTFMKNRLEVAKELLRKDGILFIHIDDIEEAYLKILTDEVFGRSNFINVIAIRSSTPSGTKTAHKDKTIIKQKDMILVYKNSENITLNPQYTKRKSWDTHYSLILNKHADGTYSFTRLVEELQRIGILKVGQKLEDIDINNKQFKEFYLTHINEICRLQSHKNKEAEKASRALVNKVYEDIKDGMTIGLYYNGQVITPLAQGIKCVYSNQKFVDDLGMLLCDFWDDIDFQNTQNEGGISFPTAKKPEMLLYRLIDMCTSTRDIVMDFFVGSGSTAAVAHKMNRQYIGVEQMNYGKNDSVQRLINVINGEQSGISKAISWNPQHPDLLDGDKYAHNSFVYCELAQANQQFVDEIMAANEPLKLQEIWSLLQEKGFLSYKISPKLINEYAEDFNDLSLEDQKRFLIECLDKNMLYIPYSDIDDEGFALSENDKHLTRQFYASR